MRIGLYNLEPKIFNTAMMQVSHYYKSLGNTVETYNHLFHDEYDWIYAFSLFDFTDKSMVTNDMICGGTGFDIEKHLPAEIENSDLDYSLFPNCKTSYIWFSRGCIRDCPWCVVKRKEGLLKSVDPKNLNPNGTYITVMDNNYFANPNWEKAIDWLKEKKQKVEFVGIDARIMDKEMATALNSLKHEKTIKFAWDNPKDDLREHLDLLTSVIKPYKLMCYVLIGFNSTEEEDLFRINTLWKEYKIVPFVMPYVKKDYYQRHFARYCNHKAIFKSHTWEEYQSKYMKKDWTTKRK